LPVRFALSTIERWYYVARRSDDPVKVLRRKPRRDRGRQVVVGGKLAEALLVQYRQHSSWSYQLHLDNLTSLARKEPELGSLPSYSSLRRYMVSHHLLRRRRKPKRGLSEGEIFAEERLEKREKRSFESEYVSGLWHLDFHHGSLKILTSDGEWARPILLAVVDDHSRLVCHAQWYLRGTAENLIHGLQQAFCKRGLPRSLMTDNGSAMLADETTQGLGRLSVLHETTLPYSPYQNGKQEVFWVQIEGRLLAMLEGELHLTLALLNQATLAWVEMEYQRKVHSETGQTPLDRWLGGTSVARECPGIDELQLAFTTRQVRTQRKSDGTISVEGTRFEISSRFRHLSKISIRYAKWDLRYVCLMDESAGVALDRLYPLDKAKNAEGKRRVIQAESTPESPAGPVGIAPLLSDLMAEYAATGLPPAYLPQEES
jgi:transposase InsO family protein